MRRVTLLFSLCLISGIAIAQTDKNCKEYYRYIQNARTLLKNDKLEEARKEFTSAKVFAKECGVSDSLAEVGIKAIIDRYKIQTLNAQRAKEEAERERNNAIKALADKKRSEAEAEKERKNAHRLQEEKLESDKKIQYMVSVLEKEGSVDSKRSLNKMGFSFKLSVVSIETQEALSSSPTHVNAQTNKSQSRDDFKSIFLVRSAFQQPKIVVDSLLATYQKRIGSKASDEIQAKMQELLKRLDDDINVNIVATHLRDSSRIELTKMRPGSPKYDMAVYIHLRATLYYAWHYTDLGKGGIPIAKKALDSAEAFSKSIVSKSAVVHSALAGLHNSYNNYYSSINDHRNAMISIEKAIEHATIAVRGDGGNYLYQRGLAVLLRNSTYLPDSVISKSQKVEVARLAFQCVRNLEVHSAFSGNSWQELCHSTIRLSDLLSSTGSFSNAIDTLNSTIELLADYKTNKPALRGVDGEKLRLLAAASGIAVDSLNHFEKSKYYLSESYKLFGSFKQDSTGNADVTRLVELNLYVDNLLKLAKNRSDTLSTIPIFSSAIEAFEKTNPFERPRYRKFTEDYHNLSIPYVKRLEINILSNNKAQVDKDFGELKRIFFPFYSRYRFDFYLGQRLIKSSRIYANYLLKQKKTSNALPHLKFASLQGIKESTDSLISIYKKPGFVNRDSLIFYQARTKYQSSGMKKFTIPVDISGVKYPFPFYVFDRAKEFDTLYAGIRDQIVWVSEARGGKVAKDIQTSFDKLLKIAFDNDVSFMDLCLYALAAATKDSTSTTSNSANSSLSNELKNKNLTQTLKILQIYVAKRDTAAVSYITNHAMLLDSLEKNKSDLDRKYYRYLTSIDVRYLRGLKRNDIEACRNAFLAKSASDLFSNELKREYYLKLTTLDSLHYRYLTIKRKSAEDSAIASHYNSLAWYSLLTNKAGRAYEYLMTSKKHNPKSVYPDSNIPHYYLFTGQIATAKTEYLRRKNLPFLPNDKALKTFKDAFLQDFKDFEDEKLYPNEIAEMKRLLLN